MKIQGNIHGQILFVSEGDIQITGKLTNAGGPPFPGTGILASKADQAVLITQHDVVMENQNFTSEPFVVKAFVLAPNGRFYGEPKPPPAGPGGPYKSLDFEGAVIISEPGTNGNNFGAVFNCTLPGCRSYKYMQSLKDAPPPYLPSVAETYWYLEDPNIDYSFYNNVSHPQPVPVPT